jgi:hypothetical protein
LDFESMSTRLWIAATACGTLRRDWSTRPHTCPSSRSLGGGGGGESLRLGEHRGCCGQHALVVLLVEHGLQVRNLIVDRLHLVGDVLGRVLSRGGNRGLDIGDRFLRRAILFAQPATTNAARINAIKRA